MKNKEIQNFIKKYKYKQSYPCVRCLKLYNIVKHSNFNVVVNYL